MSGRSEASWLRALAEANADEFRPLEVEQLLATQVRRQRSRSLAVVAATSVALVLGIAAWLPRRGANERLDEGGHYAAAATATADKAVGRTTSRDRQKPRKKAGRSERPVADGVNEEALLLPPSPSLVPASPEVDSPASPRRTPRPARVDAVDPPLSSADDLLAIARAARAARDSQAARAALTEVRERFPKSSHAGRATFLLGRVELELAQDTEQAMLWFDRYVDEFPRGPLAAQARGRILKHLADQEDPAAEAAAAAYLQHHADGPYADLARRVGPAR